MRYLATLAFCTLLAACSSMGGNAPLDTTYVASAGSVTHTIVR